MLAAQFFKNAYHVSEITQQVLYSVFDPEFFGHIVHQKNKLHKLTAFQYLLTFIILGYCSNNLFQHISELYGKTLNH